MSADRTIMHVKTHSPSLYAMGSAVLGLGLTLQAFPALGDCLADQFADILDLRRAAGGEIGEEVLGKVFSGRLEMAAIGALDATLFFDPCDRFRELVAAIASEADGQIVDVHGWPVLLVGGEIPTLAEAGGVDNPAGGGLPVEGAADVG